MDTTREKDRNNTDTKPQNDKLYVARWRDGVSRKRKSASASRRRYAAGFTLPIKKFPTGKISATDARRVNLYAN